MMNQAKQKTQAFAESIRARQRQQIFKSRRLSQENISYPLVSQTLQKFWNVDHNGLWKYIPEIEYALAEYPLEEGQDEEQEDLVNDLFYLLSEQKKFKVPQSMRFLRNGSNLVASLVSLISLQVLPEELAYWLGYMSEEDRQIVYLNILGQQFHLLAWINHPLLRKSLINDFLYLEAAVKAVKEIVGFRKIHPSRLTTLEGLSLEFQLCRVFERQIQEMRQAPIKRVMEEHMEVAVWVLAKNWQSPKCKDLFLLFNKIIVNNFSILSTIFIHWLIESIKIQPKMLMLASIEALIHILEQGMNQIALELEEREKYILVFELMRDEKRRKQSMKEQA